MFRKLLFFSTIIFSCLSIRAQHKLEYNFSAKDTLLIEQIAVQNIVMELQGQKQDIVNNLGGTFQFVIKEQTATDIVYECSFVQFGFSVEDKNSGMVMMDVDTSKKSDDDDMMANIFKGIIDAPLVVTMSKTGKISEIQGVAEMINGMFSKAGIEDEFTIELLKKSMEKQFGAESLGESFEQMTYMLPENEVKIGDEWTNQFKGKVNAENNWSLQAYNTNDFEILGNANINLLTDDDDVKMDLTGSQQTIAILDSETGFLNSMEVKQTAKGVTIMKNLNGVEVPTTINATITYKRL